jgi:uncharacterized protein (DUF488 family)
MTIYTIGFTKKTAEKFFEILRGSGARTLLDIRINNNSQLAGFTKRDDLRYFLPRLTGMSYRESLLFAPTKEMLVAYRKDKDWLKYERDYKQLIADRKAETSISLEVLEAGVVLLCSEPTPEKCHRRLAAEYLSLKRNLSAVHL